MTGSSAITSGSAAPGAQEEEAVPVARAELGRVVEHPAGSRDRGGDGRWSASPVPCRRRPTVSSVSPSNSTGIGVSVIEMYRSPSLTRLTFALSVSFGENMDKHAREQRAARIGGELRVDDLALLLRGAVRLGLRGTGWRRRPRRRRCRSGAASRSRRTSGSSSARRPPTSPGRCGPASPAASPGACPPAAGGSTRVSRSSDSKPGGQVRSSGGLGGLGNLAHGLSSIVQSVRYAPYRILRARWP